MKLALAVLILLGGERHSVDKEEDRDIFLFSYFICVAHAYEIIDEAPFDWRANIASLWYSYNYTFLNISESFEEYKDYPSVKITKNLPSSEKLAEVCIHISKYRNQLTDFKGMVGGWQSPQIDDHIQYLDSQESLLREYVYVKTRFVPILRKRNSLKKIESLIGTEKLNHGYVPFFR